MLVSALARSSMPNTWRRGGGRAQRVGGLGRREGGARACARMLVPLRSLRPPRHTLSAAGGVPSASTARAPAAWQLARTSHCLALKKVEGPMGGPSFGGTMMRRLPPTFIVRMPSSKPAGLEARQAWQGWFTPAASPRGRFSLARRAPSSVQRRAERRRRPRTRDEARDAEPRLGGAPLAVAGVYRRRALVVARVVKHHLGAVKRRRGRGGQRCCMLIPCAPGVMAPAGVTWRWKCWDQRLTARRRPRRVGALLRRRPPSLAPRPLGPAPAAPPAGGGRRPP